MTQQLYPPTQPYQPYGQQPGAPFGPPPGQFGYAPPPAPRRRTGLIIGVIAGVVVVVAGLVVGAIFLFGSKTLNTAEAEKQIVALTQDKTGVAATDVSCPTDIEAKAGDTFTCNANLDGQPVTFTIEQTDDKGNVHISLDNSFVVISQLQDEVSRQVSEQVGVDVTTTCDAGGHTVLVDGVGQPITCTVANAEDSSASVDVTATVDEQGNVTWETV